MDADAANSEVPEPNPLALLASENADDRAFGAFLLGSADHSAEVHTALLRCLSDSSPDVVSYAAQSLALHGDVPALAELMSLLDEQSGLEVNPIAWAAAVLASRGDVDDQERVRQALLRLRARGSTDVVRQVDILVGSSDLS